MVNLEAYQELQIILILEDSGRQDPIEIAIRGHSHWLLLKQSLVLLYAAKYTLVLQSH